ncbi:hypothetical protein ACIBJF_42520 [Streptomyces sp. NPDC050743]|uniref:hypothetical protein n=1 Tax=Streptomyces sp. NPDC050743 TaxID=3365634 RepID=UPI0037A1E772
MTTGGSSALQVSTAKPVATLVDTIDWRNRPYTTTCAGLSRSPFTGFLRGCPGLQAGEESDSCGAGQG